jgi:hypothetical protein
MQSGYFIQLALTGYTLQIYSPPHINGKVHLAISAHSPKIEELDTLKN